MKARRQDGTLVEVRVYEAAEREAAHAAETGRRDAHNQAEIERPSVRPFDKHAYRERPAHVVEIEHLTAQGIAVHPRVGRPEPGDMIVSDERGKLALVPAAEFASEYTALSD